jgi:hypothetical protein
MIDHIVVSLYASNNQSDTSMIKFGSYDKLGMEEKGYGLKTFKTISVTSWALRASHASMRDREVFSGERKFLIDP